MADQSKEVEVEIPPFLTLYKDGSVHRNQLRPSLPPSPDPGADGVVSKDITLNPQLGLWARLFIPSPPPEQRIPVVLYFHGGGFMFGTPSWANSHSFGTRLSKLSGALIISASYRLAPEHRLPAAIEDGFSAFQWVHSQALLQISGKSELVDPWLQHADFSRCFIAGESAGGNLAHLLAMKALNKPMSAAAWAPLCIKGLILIHPGFMRNTTRTQEELDCYQDARMNWALADKCLGCVLPVGSDRNSPYHDPLPAFTSPDSSLSLPAKTLVALADNDALHFYCLEYVRALECAGCNVELVMSHGVGHAFFVEQPDSEQAQTLMQSISTFIAAEEDKAE